MGFAPPVFACRRVSVTLALFLFLLCLLCVLFVVSSPVQSGIDPELSLVPQSDLGGLAFEDGVLLLHSSVPVACGVSVQEPGSYLASFFSVALDGAPWYRFSTASDCTDLEYRLSSSSGGLRVVVPVVPVWPEP
ncbi:hypothetical protein Bca52824_027509 [Brassica carinata]|uniref:Uncharacterized protein n=1 Tax=Brassica carinata TaxID=52824 RepID=A0A8X7VAL7_BRACI|nr:hypothetical protein Bca52824_027509 [Brassica carinata]